MYHPPETFSFDPEYQKAVSNLKKRIKESKKDMKKIEEIFANFAAEYTVTPELWTKQIRLLRKKSTDFHALLQQSFSHFYSYAVYDFAKIFCQKCRKSLHENLYFSKSFYSIQKGIAPEEILRIPNESSAIMSGLYDEKSKRPFTDTDKKINEEACKLRLRLIESLTKTYQCETDLEREQQFEEWINILFEWKRDEKFAYQTIEYKLAEMWKNKNFWKAYINVMKGKNLKIMLTLYHRYTRLFLSDAEMKAKFEEEKENSVKNPAITNLPDLEYFLFEENKIPPSKCHHHIFDGIVEKQIYSLPKTIINYATLNCESNYRLKLYSICKSLFLQNPIPICHQLIIKPRTKRCRFAYQSLKIAGNDELNLLSKFFITNCLQFIFPYEMKNANSAILHSIIPKIWQCDARFIFVKDQIISYDELKFLVKPTKTKKFRFQKGGILKNGDGNSAMSLGELMELTLNACELKVNFDKKYPFSSPPILLSSFEITSKMRIFDVGYLEYLPDIHDFWSFTLENVENENAKKGNAKFKNFVWRAAEKISENAVETFNNVLDILSSSKVIHGLGCYGTKSDM